MTILRLWRNLVPKTRIQVVDRRIIRCLQCNRHGFCSSTTPEKENPSLLKYFQDKIKATGPITVAEFMKSVLINPHSGYYMNRDVFGSSGDFITSPEISQMFGELIAIWFFNEWSRLKQPSPVQLVEFGPGRGTLAEDILRVFSRLNINKDAFSLHLIEVSPFLRKRQKQKLCGLDTPLHEWSDDLFVAAKGLETKYAIPVTWHCDIDSVPDAFSFFLAHEFFDALPIHKFQKTAEGWREVLIDCENNDDAQLRFVLSKNETPSSKLLIEPDETRDSIEVSPESGILIEKLAKRMKEHGGISLIIDYGYVNREKTDTFRGFHKHELKDPLSNLGHVDLTADVDFTYLMSRLSDFAVAVGPVTQASFLKGMSVDVRLKKLTLNATDEEKKSLQSGYEMLTSPLQMGERFKFLALYPEVLKDFLSRYPPPGFS